MSIDNLDPSSELREKAKECKTPEENLEAGSSNLSLDDLDSAAGGRGRRKYEPRRHIGPDFKPEE